MLQDLRSIQITTKGGGGGAEQKRKLEYHVPCTALSMSQVVTYLIAKPLKVANPTSMLTGMTIQAKKGAQLGTGGALGLCSLSHVRSRDGDGTGYSNGKRCV